MQDFPANSAKVRGSEDPRETKKVEQITSAEAEKRKRGIGRQFKETFISGSARSAGEYMAKEVVVPAIRDTLFDAIQGGIERLIYGDRSGHPRRPGMSSYSGLGHVNYQGMSSSSRPPTSRSLSQQARSRHDFGDIVIQNRQEAVDVLDRMYDILSRYGTVPVADLYELTGIASSHADHQWGWTSLRGAKVARMRNGAYLLDLPNPEPLGR